MKVGAGSIAQHCAAKKKQHVTDKINELKPQHVFSNNINLGTSHNGSQNNGLPIYTENSEVGVYEVFELYLTLRYHANVRQ